MPTSTTTSIITSLPIFFFKKSHLKSKKYSAQIIIPKRHSPTLSPIISIDIKLKRHKSYPLPFAHRRISFPTEHSQYFHHYHQHHYSYYYLNNTTTTTAINTTTSTKTATQRPIQYLTELNISLPPWLYISSTSQTISFLSSSQPFLIFPCTPVIGTLGDSPTRPRGETQRRCHHLAILKTTAQFST